MTAKEKFQVLRHLVLETPLDKQNIRELENKFDIHADDIEQALTSYDELVKEHELTIKLFNSANEQLNELVKDVKRFMELDNKLQFDSEDEAIECRVLYRKLRKLGKEE